MALKYTATRDDNALPRRRTELTALSIRLVCLQLLQQGGARDAFGPLRQLKLRDGLQLLSPSAVWLQQASIVAQCPHSRVLDRHCDLNERRTRFTSISH